MSVDPIKNTAASSRRKHYRTPSVREEGIKNPLKAIWKVTSYTMYIYSLSISVCACVTYYAFIIGLDCDAFHFLSPF